jgi:NDP-sugar pyrophosphorylase family protein
MTDFNQGKPQATLQAILICDSFSTSPNTSLRPLTYSRAACMLPLCGNENYLLIDSAIDSLLAAGVDQCLVFVHGRFSQQITQHVQRHSAYNHQTKFNTSESERLVCIQAQESAISSVGDVLRHIESVPNLIQGEFLLMSALCVTSIDLRRLVAQHRATRLVDKACIATICLARQEVDPLQCADDVLQLNNNSNDDAE